MKKLTKKEIAERTLAVIKEGRLNDIDISRKIKTNIEKTITVSPDDFEEYLKIENKFRFESQEIEVVNLSTIEAIISNEGGGKIGVLNFASAKNPGGGFLGGAQAQEETLARSSSLYASLTKDETMYKTNRHQQSFIYTNYGIYSPETLFWFDDNGELLERLHLVDIITMPAPNKGAMLQHNRKSEIEAIPDVFKKRIRCVIQLAVANNVDILILGAWGCGVFRNEVNDVACYFKEIIDEFFPLSFKKICFAIYDQSEKKLNFNIFKEVFSVT